MSELNILSNLGLNKLLTLIKNKFDTKVDKEQGKGLSTNNYTDEEKNKLTNIEENANKYTLPVGGTAIGGVKNGGDIAIDDNGDMTVGDGKITAGKITTDAITTTKIKKANVTRNKLANDALYSPMKTITADRNIEVDDLGKTLRPKYSSSNTTFTLTLDAVSSAAFPVGSEIAVCRMYNSNKINIAFSGVIVTYLVGGRLANKDDNVTVTVPDVGGMLAIKKMSVDSTYGDYWLITGNAEVVS